MHLTFAHHVPSEAGIETIKRIREAYSNLLDELNALPASRQLSVAITNLETSAMWAIKGIVMNDPNSKVER